MLLNQEEADCLVYLKGLRVVYAAERLLIASGRNQGWGSNLVNFLIILEAEERGAKRRSAPAPEKVQISTSHLWKKSILEEKQGRNRSKVMCSVVGNGSAPSDGKKALQDTDVATMGHLRLW